MGYVENAPHTVLHVTVCVTMGPPHGP